MTRLALGVALKQKPRHTHYHRKITPVVVLDEIVKWLIWVVMIVYSLSLLILPIWMILSSFRDIYSYNLNPFAWPEQWGYFDNYRVAYENLKVRLTDGTTYNFFQLALFSLIWSVMNPLITNFFTLLMAYVICKYKFPGRKFLYNFGIVLMIIPIIGSLPSAMMVKKALGIYDNMFLMLLTSPVGCFSGFGFLLFYGAFKSMPWDYAEAVFVDGGGHWQAFLRCYFPMVLPIFMVQIVLGFIGSWNDYSTFMLWLPSTPNLAYGLYLFQENATGVANSNVVEILAGFSIVIIPTVILYFASHRLINSNFMIGGIKG